MTFNITRRQALKIAVAGALTPVLLNAAMPVESELVRCSDFQPDPYGSPSEWTPAQVAKFVAGWELAAQQHNRPKKWRRLKYDNAIQWCDGRTPLVIFYGIGPSSWTAERLQDLGGWLRDPCGRRVLAEERVARGRAFAIVSVGRLSMGLRYEMRKPAFKRDPSVMLTLRETCRRE